MTECVLVEHVALVDGDHVLDVDEGILAPVQLESLQRLLDQVADVLPLHLAVVYLVPYVLCNTKQQPVNMSYCNAASM